MGRWDWACVIVTDPKFNLHIFHCLVLGCIFYLK